MQDPAERAPLFDMSICGGKTACASWEHKLNSTTSSMEAADFGVSFTFGPKQTYLFRAGLSWAYSDVPTPPPEIRKILLDPRNNDGRAYLWDVGLPMEGTGPDGRDLYMLRWQDLQGKQWYEDDRLGPAYTRLSHFITRVGGKTHHTTFGPAQAYFSVGPDGYSYQNLPPGLEEYITEFSFVRRPATVALGVGGAYVVVFNDGTVAWDLQPDGWAVYPELEKMIAGKDSESDKRGGVKYVALNPYTPGQFFILFGNNSVHLQLPDSWRADINTALEYWRASLVSWPKRVQGARPSPRPELPARPVVAPSALKRKQTGDWERRLKKVNEPLDATLKILEAIGKMAGA
ncbi:hypothetical protein MKEN_00558500 [Mycena kentingensis (nom. inval.)]|nr:hypothetical protein MKEN_00558500 [Mycena kentingensis (nom. inval.)]